MTVTKDGCDLLSADSGEDAVAVFALSRAHRCDPSHKGKRRAKPFQLVGRLPVGSYPTVATARSVDGKLAWISARGLGVGPNPHGPNPNSPNDSDDFINSFQYLPSIVRGSSGILRFPSDKKIRNQTPKADRQIHPLNQQRAPANTPIRPNGPIKHVFFIVKENRTYDQVLGDDPRGRRRQAPHAVRQADHARTRTPWSGAFRSSITSTRTPRPRSTATTGPPPARCRTT